jgi:lysozyme
MPDQPRIPASTWKTIGATAAVIASLAAYEGYRGAAYDDGVGVQTIGFGTTQTASGPVKRGDKTDPVRAVITLQRDADAHAKGLAGCIGDVPLRKGEWDAYVSWTYNVGVSSACHSTLVKKLKQTPPDYAGACKELLKWNRAGGMESSGLTKRRQAEYKMCVGDQTALNPLPIIAAALLFTLGFFSGYKLV